MTTPKVLSALHRMRPAPEAPHQSGQATTPLRMIQRFVKVKRLEVRPRRNEVRKR